MLSSIVRSSHPTGHAMLRQIGFHRLVFQALCFWLFSAGTVTLADWPSFLGGPERDSAVNFEPPLQWAPETQVSWKTDLPGHGQSSPVIVGNLIYLTAIDGPMKETNQVLCFDRSSGKQLWQKTFPSSLPVKNDIYTCRAAPTPTADQNGVYAFFESGNLIALGTDGEVRWQRDLIADYGQYQGRFGIGGSLAQDAKHVFVLADNDGPAYLAAISKETGETVWKTKRENRIAWSSPMMLSVAGTTQIVVSASGTVDGYSPENGALLWSFDEVGGNTVASPVPAGQGRFLVGASPGRNGEHSEGAKRSNMLMEVTKTDDGFKASVVWRNEQATSSFGSPIMHDGHAYYTNRTGVLFCIDAQTGETAYTARLPQSNWATPIGIGDRIYVFGKSGITTVVQSGATEKILAKNSLWEVPSDDGGRGRFGGETQYGVAPTPGGFVVRTGSRLYGIGTP